MKPISWTFVQQMPTSLVPSKIKIRLTNFLSGFQHNHSHLKAYPDLSPLLLISSSFKFSEPGFVQRLLIEQLMKFAVHILKQITRYLSPAKLPKKSEKAQSTSHFDPEKISPSFTYFDLQFETFLSTPIDFRVKNVCLKFVLISFF